MGWVTVVIAGLGLGLSLTLAAIKIWETFLSRARFHVVCDWLDLSDTELEFRFTIANVGHRPDSVRAISIVSEAGEPYRSERLTRQLPVLLGPGSVSPLFTLVVRTDVAHDPGTSLFVGKGQIVLTDSAGRDHRFPVQNPYDGPGIYGWEDEPPPPDSDA